MLKRVSPPVRFCCHWCIGKFLHPPYLILAKNLRLGILFQSFWKVQLQSSQNKTKQRDNMQRVKEWLCGGTFRECMIVPSVFRELFIMTCVLALPDCLRITVIPLTCSSQQQQGLNVPVSLFTETVNRLTGIVSCHLIWHSLYTHAQTHTPVTLPPTDVPINNLICICPYLFQGGRLTQWSLQKKTPSIISRKECSLQNLA